MLKKIRKLITYLRNMGKLWRIYQMMQEYQYKCPKCGAEIPLHWVHSAYYHQFKCGTPLRIVKKYETLKVIIRG